MFNELLFSLQIVIINITVLIVGKFGKSALTAYVSLLFIMANIFVIKQINLFGLTITSADSFIIGISFSLNLLQEFWGKEQAQKAVWISFILSIFYVLISHCIVAYIPASIDDAQIHLMYLTTYTVRIVAASFVTYLITQFIDIHFYAYLKKITHDQYFIARNYISISTSQFIDTVLFSYLGLFGIVSNIGHIIFMSYTIKLITIVCATPFLAFTKKVLFLKKEESNA